MIIMRGIISWATRGTIRVFTRVIRLIRRLHRPSDTPLIALLPCASQQTMNPSAAPIFPKLCSHYSNSEFIEFLSLGKGSSSSLVTS